MGKTGLLSNVGNDCRLLVFDHPPRQRLLVLNVARRRTGLLAALAKMPIHLLRGFITVRNGIKGNHRAQFLQQHLEERLGLMLSPDRVGKPDQ